MNGPWFVAQHFVSFWVELIWFRGNDLPMVSQTGIWKVLIGPILGNYLRIDCSQVVLHFRFKEFQEFSLDEP